MRKSLPQRAHLPLLAPPDLSAQPGVHESESLHEELNRHCWGQPCQLLTRSHRFPGLLEIVKEIFQKELNRHFWLAPLTIYLPISVQVHEIVKEIFQRPTGTSDPTPPHTRPLNLRCTRS